MAERVRKPGWMMCIAAAWAVTMLFAAPLQADDAAGAGEETQPLTSQTGDDQQSLASNEDQVNSSASLGTDRSGDNVSSAALQTLGALGLVAMAILATRYWLTRHQPRRGGCRQGDLLETIERLPLGPQRQVVALRFRDQLLLIGESPAGMTLLSEQPLQPAPDTERQAEETATAGGQTAPRTLSRTDLLGLMGGEASSAESTVLAESIIKEAAPSHGPPADEADGRNDQADDAASPAQAAVQSRDDVDALLARLRTQKHAEEVTA